MHITPSDCNENTAEDFLTLIYFDIWSKSGNSNSSGFLKKKQKKGIISILLFVFISNIHATNTCLQHEVNNYL